MTVSPKPEGVHRRAYQAPTLRTHGSVSSRTMAVGRGSSDWNGAGKNNPGGGPNAPPPWWSG